MTFKTLTILEKSIGDPLESVLTTQRTAAPVIIQPTYTFDVSDMYGIFIPSASLGTDFYWSSNYLEVSTGFANGVYLRESSLGPDFKWIGGLLDASITTTEASVNILWNWNVSQDTSIQNINSSIGILNNWNVSEDASIVELRLKDTQIDASIVSLRVRVDNHDTSIAILNQWNVWQDTSIAILNQWNVNQDISIAWLDGARRLDLLRDVSIVDVSNNNILEWDGNIGYWKNAEPEEIDDYFYDKLIIDASLLWVTSPMNSSTATQVRFDRTIGYVYGSVNTPLTGSITMSASDALLGVVDLIIHKENSTGIALPATFKRLSGSYDGSENNFIYVQYIDASNQLYTINQIQ